MGKHYSSNVDLNGSYFLWIVYYLIQYHQIFWISIRGSQLKTIAIHHLYKLQDQNSNHLSLFPHIFLIYFCCKKLLFSAAEAFNTKPQQNVIWPKAKLFYVILFAFTKYRLLCRLTRYIFWWKLNEVRGEGSNIMTNYE